LESAKAVSRAFARNGKSIAYSTKCGYIYEATLKEETWKEGEWQDIVVLACFRANWKEKWDAYMR
jgi:RimJ/RimL family protein N-acetyltransferase